MRIFAALFVVLLVSSCGKTCEQFDTSLQATRAPGSDTVSLVALVTPADWEKGNPDVGMATFELSPGETKTKDVTNKQIQGRRYTFAGSLSSHEVPVVSVTTSVYQGESLVFQSKQEFVGHGL